MAFAPFRDFLALVILDGDFDLPQHQLAGLADGRSKSGDGLRGVEIKDIQKILMLEVISRLHPAAGQQRIGGADNGGVPKCGSDVEIIITFQKGTVNDADNIAPVVVPVFIYKLRRHTLHLIGKSVFTGNVKALFQRHDNHITLETDLDGSELFEVSLAELTPTKPTDEATDTTVGTAGTSIAGMLCEGRFALYLAGEPYKSGLKAQGCGKLKKAVFSIELDPDEEDETEE